MYMYVYLNTYALSIITDRPSFSNTLLCLQDHKVNLDLQDHVENRVLKDLLVYLGQQDLKDLLVHQDLVERLDRVVHPDRGENLDSQGLKVHEEKMALLDHLVELVHPDLQAAEENLVRPDLLVLEERLDHLETLVPVVREVRLVQVEHLEKVDQQDHVVNQELGVNLAKLVQLAHQDLRVTEAKLDFQDLLDLLDSLDRLGSVESQDLQVKGDRLDHEENLEQLEKQVEIKSVNIKYLAINHVCSY